MTQYPVRHLAVKCCDVLKLHDLCLELSDQSEIYQAHPQ